MCSGTYILLHYLLLTWGFSTKTPVCSPYILQDWPKLALPGGYKHCFLTFLALSIEGFPWLVSKFLLKQINNISTNSNCLKKFGKVRPRACVKITKNCLQSYVHSVVHFKLCVFGTVVIKFHYNTFNVTLRIFFSIFSVFCVFLGYIWL